MKYTPSYKYLGVLFEEHLKEKPTVDALTNAATKSLGRITSILRKTEKSRDKIL